MPKSPTEMMNTIRQRNDIFKVLKEKDSQPRAYIQQRYPADMQAK